MKALRAFIAACVIAAGMVVATPQPALADGQSPTVQVCTAAYYAYYGNGVVSSIAHITDPALHFQAMFAFVQTQLAYPDLPYWEQERVFVYYLIGWCVGLGGEAP